jgi:aspartyl-tRNA(Asn)/glutamyl-tRNA(Gln) amidotransferase subunit C
MIDRATVQHVARLARLGLTDAEIEIFGPQLSRILAFVEHIGHATPDIAATPNDPPLRLRPDEVRPSLDRDLALANAAVIEAGFVRVPPVLD